MMDHHNIALKLFRELERDDFMGWDPFDGLNSSYCDRFSLLAEQKYFRLVWIQLFKKSPINIRPLTLVAKGYNIKGLALLISSLVALQNKEENQFGNEISRLVSIIKNHKAIDRKYYCWGYNFPWQARAFNVERWKPNMIVSTFVAQAFLDLYEVEHKEEFLAIAMDVGHFIEQELILDDSGDKICFGYIPGEVTRVHNANLMGAKLFARLFHFTSNNHYKDLAIKSTDYSVSSQRVDGAWFYGEENHHQWIDNFHTGFNLVAISDVQKRCGVDYNESINLGLAYHIRNHYLPDMTPKYYAHAVYPIDIHNYAQGVITFLTFDQHARAKSILDNALSTMFDRKKYYFYYQRGRFLNNRINYLRWSQAWMLFAICKFVQYPKKEA